MGAKSEGNAARLFNELDCIEEGGVKKEAAMMVILLGIVEELRSPPSFTA
jgi:hypothetical protein